MVPAGSLGVRKTERTASLLVSGSFFCQKLERFPSGLERGWGWVGDSRLLLSPSPHLPSPDRTPSTH